MTEEGIAPQAVDGKMSTNTDAKLPADEPSGIGKVLDQIFPYDAASAAERLGRAAGLAGSLARQLREVTNARRRASIGGDDHAD